MNNREILNKIENKHSIPPYLKQMIVTWGREAFQKETTVDPYWK